MIMIKKEYLENCYVQEFVNYFSRLLQADESNNQQNNKSFYYISHSDTKKSDKKGKLGILRDAASEYSWSRKNVEINNAELKCISKQLKRTFSSSLEKEALCVCIKVLDWGGVQNGAHGIVKLYCENRLIKSITEALENLNHEEVFLDGFLATNVGSQKYRMNASFTKIYSLLSDSPFIIYDSRVAAALGLIVKRFWLENYYKNSLPGLLSFARLDDRVGRNQRNATNKSRGIEFKKLSGKKKEFKHAEWNVRANWVVEAALINVDCFAEKTDKLEQVRAVEAALFMIGNDVSDLS